MENDNYIVEDNNLNEAEISEILGESSSQVGVYGNIEDVSYDEVGELTEEEVNELNELREKLAVSPSYASIGSENEIVSVDLAENVNTTPTTITENTEENTALMTEEEAIESLATTKNLRFKGADWYENAREANIIVAGIGGIGGWLTLFLSRINPYNITIFDNDTVSLVNMAGQFYSMDSIGKTKVKALQDLCTEMSDYRSIIAFDEKYTMDSLTSDIMMCGFDNMAARHIFYTNWKKHILKLSPEQREKCLFIDGRLLMEEFQVLAITGNDMESMQQYETKFLFSDEEMYAPTCSAKQTSHMAAMIASTMVNVFTNFLSPTKDWEIPRKVPFLTEYDAPSMLFKTTM